MEGNIQYNKTIILYISFHVNADVKVKVGQLCLTLSNPMDYAVHGILQVGILE